MDVETETSRDWAKDVDTETPSRLSLISGTNVTKPDQLQGASTTLLGDGPKTPKN